MSSTATDSKTGALAYMPQLDSLRTPALIVVLVTHYKVFEGAGALDRWSFFIGASGLDFFFVMSGFLISTILLGGKNLVESGNQSVGFTLRRFYVRRFLRIFPAYYGTLLVLALLEDPSVLDFGAWHLTYTTNVYLVLSKHILYPTLHFWSLAVEEQFYIFWPALIFFTPRRWLPAAIFVMSMIAVVSRAVLWAQDQNLMVIRFATTSILDYFSLGALLALYRSDPERYAVPLRRLRQIAFRVGVPVALLLYALSPWYERNAYTAFCGLPNALFFVWLVDRTTTKEWTGVFGYILDLRWFNYIGRISYGAYLVHLPVEWQLLRMSWTYDWPIVREDVWLRFVLCTVITLAIAALSWEFYEGPINRQKARFAYRKEPASE